MFGDKSKLNPINHLLGTAYGWGGNPEEAAIYMNVVPEDNDGNTPYTLTIAEKVPVDGFTSITVYNSKGYLEKNSLDAYSINNVTAQKNQDGTVTIHFGATQATRITYLSLQDGIISFGCINLKRSYSKDLGNSPIRKPSSDENDP